MQMLAEISGRGEKSIAATKTWAAGTQATIDQWHRLALGIFMCGTDGNQYFCFSYGSRTNLGDSALVPNDPNNYWSNTARVGVPAASASAVGPGWTPWTRQAISGGAMYSRRFTNGIVVVNGTNGAANYTLPAGTYTKITGGTISGQVSVPAKDAIIAYT
jgi:hypothetical protein